MVEQVGGSRGDDRERANLPGGVRRTLAQQGPIVCGGAGIVTMIVCAALASVTAGELVALILVGAVLGAFVGWLIQTDARERLGKPSVAKLEPARPNATERKAVRVTADATATNHGLRPNGRWARAYLACARSVAAYYAVVDSLPDGAGRRWMAEIGVTLNRELAEALRLARLGENLDPDDPAEPTETAQRVLDRLHAAEKSFADTTDRAVAIALDLRDESDFVRVRAQLDLLAEQAQHLLKTDF